MTPYTPWSGASRLSSWDPKYMYETLNGVQAIEAWQWLPHHSNLVEILFCIITLQNQNCGTDSNHITAIVEQHLTAESVHALLPCVSLLLLPTISLSSLQDSAKTSPATQPERVWCFFLLLLAEIPLSYYLNMSEKHNLFLRPSAAWPVVTFLSSLYVAFAVNHILRLNCRPNLYP